MASDSIKTIPRIVDEFTQYAREERTGIFTMNWDRFGRHADRFVFKKAFLESVQEKLKENDVLIAYGEHVIVVINDHHFK